MTNHIAEGITHPSIDELLDKVDSKYRLVLFAAKRARQINAYYSQLGEGLLESVGPLVETSVQEKPLSIALREIEAGVLECNEFDPEAEAAAAAEAEAAEPDFSLDPFGDPGLA
ncbi:DNA-directed RNA polymerase subunit omega [Propionicicella superfundia]|uniref:DNA-directed RNA polymerase subunit omega n=1 Tax=Propionicicella superfundia TaxID=348582 RepID=UPI0004122B33|nr:DNA-directed RNA polymerase subunit omega [Propionicicella superfundia]